MASYLILLLFSRASQKGRMQDINPVTEQEYIKMADVVQDISDFLESNDSADLDIAKKNMLLSLINYLNYDIEHPETS